MSRSDPRLYSYRNQKLVTMKKILFLAALIMVFVSCNKNHECRYDEQYDSSTKKCECVTNNETLYGHCKSIGEYLSVSEVFGKYAQRIKNPSEYKLYSHAGDTVKFCGWLYVAMPNKDTVFYTDQMCHFNKVAIGAPNVSVEIDIDKSAFDMLDVREMSFATGILQFPENVPSSNECFTMPFCFKIIDIHN